MTSDLEHSRSWEICRELVAFDTVPERSNVAAAQWAADVLDRAGWTVRWVRDHALGADKATVLAWAGPQAPGGLLLSGHLDVVPWETQRGWTRPALELGRDDRRMYGRGVADMKGFVAGCLELAERLDRKQLSRPVALLLTCDEEPGCLGIARQLEEIGRLMREIPTPSEAVLGEPSSWHVFSAHRGHVRLPVTVLGRGGHSSRPDLGINAIDAAADAVAAVRRLAGTMAARASERARRLYPQHPAVPFNVGTIRGGVAINMIPEACEVALGFRPAEPREISALLAELKDAIGAAVKAAHPEARVEYGEPVITPPLVPGPEGPTARALRMLTGQDEFLGAPYATDAAHLQQLGMSCYIWGPGELEQAHQPDESLLLSSFAALPSRLETLVYRTCVQPSA